MLQMLRGCKYAADVRGCKYTYVWLMTRDKDKQYTCENGKYIIDNRIGG